jgi:hypothetical protein
MLDSVRASLDGSTDFAGMKQTLASMKQMIDQAFSQGGASGGQGSTGSGAGGNPLFEALNYIK